MSEMAAGAWLHTAARVVPHRTALHDIVSGEQWTYRALDRLSDRIGNALLELGLRRGDRLACWCRTGTSYVLLYLAAVKVGIVVVPVNERLTFREAAFVLGDCTPTWLAFDDSHSEEVQGLDPGQVRRIQMDGRAAPGVVSFADLMQGAARPPSSRAQPEDVFAIGYTSGTTGFPKGAILTHAGVAHVNRTNAEGYRLVDGSRGLYTGSMSFSASVPAFLLTHLSVRGTILIFSGQHEQADVVAAVGEHGCTYTSVAPPNVRAFADAARRRPEQLETLASVLQSAGKVRHQDLIELNDAVDGRLVTGWGMTEHSGGLATALSVADSRLALGGAVELLESTGTSVPGCSVRVDSDSPNHEQAEGELLLRGPSVTPGYWNRPEANARALKDGWYHTGDIGRLDDQGRVHVLERRTDMIVSGGMNVYPAEVEAVLSQHPGVAECAVVGMPHERWGMGVTAVVTRRLPTVTAEELIEFCRQRMAGYKKPTSVVFAEELPRTVSGKLQRGRVRDGLGSG